MASVIGQTDKTGNEKFKVTVTRTKQGYRETKTFNTRKLAEAWGAKREKELDAAIATGKAITKTKIEGKTLGDAIGLYISDSEKAMGKTKAQVLNTIKNEYEISRKRCDAITSVDIVSFAKQLGKRPNLSSPATVLNYVAHLQAVFTIAKPMYGLGLDKSAMEDAMVVLRKMKIVAKPKNRDRRPTLSELDQLLAHFSNTIKRRPNSCPMVKIITFALFSTRRQDEILRIEWKDYDPENKRVLVRDMKHPGDKMGNDVWVNLPDPCCAIIDNMPRIGPRIFPYSTDAVSANFTRACKLLGIEDLRFHDLRHEGISRLFEMGEAIQFVAKISGHRSWASLQRYTHIIAKGDKYEGWPWIEAASTKPSGYINAKA